jgi:uncharacterized protein (DUF1684 family)
MSDYLSLYDYRCRVAAMYRTRNQATLAGEDGEAVLQRFRAARDELFANHPQSALDEEQRSTFTGLHYFPYNPSLRFVADIKTDVEPMRQAAVMNADDLMSMTTVGHVRFTVGQEDVVLSLYWLDIYGGGLFLPFRDATCPGESYGGGRYLCDTIKGSDFVPIAGVSGYKRIMLDFNYAYNPSCAYSHAWTCPLAPTENRLHVPIRAGEQRYRD